MKLLTNNYFKKRKTILLTLMCAKRAIALFQNQYKENLVFKNYNLTFKLHSSLIVL